MKMLLVVPGLDEPTDGILAAMLKVSSLDGSVGKRLIADYSCEKWVERVRRIINDTGASAC